MLFLLNLLLKSQEHKGEVVQLKGFSRPFSLLVMLLALLASPLSRATNNISVAPAPAWVTPLPVNTAIATPDAISDGEFYLLHNRQLKIDSRLQAYYYHSAVRIENEAGLERNSTLTVTYDPSYQTVTYHQVQVIRDGHVIDHLDLGKFKNIQREKELEYAIYDGRRTSVYFFEDLRVGDVVELSFTRYGKNPALEDLHNSYFSVEFSVPVAEDYIRVVSALPVLHYKTYSADNLEVQSKQTDLGKEYIIHQKNLVPVPHDDETPAWYTDYGAIHFSNTRHWQEVARWGARLYQPFSQPDAAIQQLAQDLTREFSTPREKATALLRFVQTEIRYMGIELGSSSFVPHATGDILQRRFGDCKDKTVLLVALLKAIGIEAYPVLVNTGTTAFINQSLPGATQFNHVITQLIVDSEHYWVDPTITMEKGLINSDAAASYQYGLVLKNNTDGITPIHTQKHKLPDMEVEEHFQVKGEGAEATDFSVVTIFRRNEANQYRARLARSSASDIQSQNLNYYARYYPSIELAQDIQIQDDQDANLITVSEKYLIARHWNLNEAGTLYNIPFYTTEVQYYLDEPNSMIRHRPFRLTHPVHIRQKTIIDLPSSWTVSPQADSLQNKWFSFKNKRQYKDQQIIKEVEFKSRADHVNAGEIADYMEQIEKADNALGVYLTYSLEEYDPEFTGDNSSAWWLIYLGVLVLLLIFAIADPTKKRQGSQQTRTQFYPLSVTKFSLLNIFTFGLYQYYWMYRNFQFLRAQGKDKIMPLGRAVFLPLFVYSFYQRLRDFESPAGDQLPVNNPLAGLLAVLFLGSNIIASINDYGFLLGLLNFVCLLPALQFINQLNAENQDDYQRNSGIRLSHIALMLVCGHLTVFTALGATNFLPSSMVVQGKDLWSRDIRFMHRIGVIKPDEELRYFYSSALFSYADDGNGLTDKRVFSYWKDDHSSNIQKRSAFFDEIASIEESYSKNELDDTVVTIVTKAGDEFYIYLSAVDGGDKKFVEDLKRSLPSAI